MNNQNKLKGQSGEYIFIFTMVFFVGFVIFLVAQAQTTNPDIEVFSGFDVSIFVASILGVAGACVIATGLPCAAALVFFNFLTFMTSGNGIIFSLILTPILATLGFIIAKLARGSSN